MSHRTVEISSFDEYLAEVYPGSDEGSLEGRAADISERTERLARFPYSVMLQVSFAELDFANRWCWENFGPCDGDCMQRNSEYRVCEQSETHSHDGQWTSYWFAKVDYNFGFNEWYFAASADRDRFLAHVDNINWSENYPK
jgi:hypothetical protein